MQIRNGDQSHTPTPDLSPGRRPRVGGLRRTTGTGERALGRSVEPRHRPHRLARVRLDNASSEGAVLAARFATSAADLDAVLAIRRATFCNEQGYTNEDVVLRTGEGNYHVLCTLDGQPVAAHSWQVGHGRGDLSFERHFDLGPHYDRYGSLAFFSKGAVLRQHRGTKIANLMYSVGYQHCVDHGIRYLVTDCRVGNAVSRAIFPGLGFARIGECVKGALGPVLVWGMRTEDCKFATRTPCSSLTVGHRSRNRIEVPTCEMREVGHG